MLSDCMTPGSYGDPVVVIRPSGGGFCLVISPIGDGVLPLMLLVMILATVGRRHVMAGTRDG